MDETFNGEIIIPDTPPASMLLVPDSNEEEVITIINEPIPSDDQQPTSQNVDDIAHRPTNSSPKAKKINKRNTFKVHKTPIKMKVATQKKKKKKKKSTLR
eukprot:TRINITY_DN1727_c0_g1_i1.p1 TRINITY_DN1727_c0_g1~~TRINITY_DN1727_c0_g1_i1.p1  ORF type:complete len:100 (-),score=14.89 TRINITY_DN1727_c0_g1_i1:36-335(-)